MRYATVEEQLKREVGLKRAKYLKSIGMIEDGMIYRIGEVVNEDTLEVVIHKIPSIGQAIKFLESKGVNAQIYDSKKEGPIGGIIAAYDFTGLVMKKDAKIMIFLNEFYRRKINCENPKFDY